MHRFFQVDLVYRSYLGVTKINDKSKYTFLCHMNVLTHTRNLFPKGALGVYNINNGAPTHIQLPNTNTGHMKSVPNKDVFLDSSSLGNIRPHLILLKCSGKKFLNTQQ